MKTPDIRPSGGRPINLQPRPPHVVNWCVGVTPEGYRLAGGVHVAAQGRFALPAGVEVRPGEVVWVRERRQAKPKWGRA
jgi:hypothetical protein